MSEAHLRVTVITPTWRRHQELMERCVESVYRQTYSQIEHIIVSDGPDRELADLLALDLWRRPMKPWPLNYRALKFKQLPDHPAGDVDYGSRARNHGLKYASGELVAYLDDDNAWRPDHLEQLAAAVQDVDFAYSQMIRHPAGDIIGDAPPKYGQIDTSLIIHKRGLPERAGMWPLPHEIRQDKHAPDWGVVERWLNAGATWAHVPSVTVDYYQQ